MLSENIDNIEMEDSIRSLLRIKSGNMEEVNRYWMEERKKMCIFCKTGKDNLEHYVKECKIVKGWFAKLGNNEERRIEVLINNNLGIEKAKVLKKLWKEKKKILKNDRIEE